MVADRVNKDLKRIVMLCFVLMVSLSLYSQSVVPITETSGFYKEVYHVLALDKTVRHGLSTLYYKGKVIEKGRYRDNKQVGRWRFFNLNSILEYEYDFDKQEVVMLSGVDRHDLKRSTPCLFKGSPLIPYLFLVSNLGYPEQAKSDDVEGKLVLALKIDKKGEIYGFYISEKLHPVIDKAVVDVAKTMPQDWEFLAATNRGQAVNSEYHIAIEFEIELE